MFIGIDVGGTFTDAVAVQDGKLLAMAKAITTHTQLLDGVLRALDEVLGKIKKEDIERVTLSTTIVTNQVVEGREEPTDIYVIPGPGADVTELFPVRPCILPGYTDHRGMVREKLTLPKHPKGSGHCAVSAKFAVRNPEEEKELAQWAREAGYDFVSEGSKLSGTLNFPRRTNSAYYNSAVSNGFTRFRKSVEDALVMRGIIAPLYILKADGGSLPMEQIAVRPVETVFTGPAASVLGMSALLAMPSENTVAIDIGGTTSDISLWENGEPVMARGGVDIKEYPTSVRSFMVDSVGIGGDSAVRVQADGTVAVGPERRGAPMALGGTWPTLGDALITVGADHYGDAEQARLGVEKIRSELPNGADLTTLTVAHYIVDAAVNVIVAGIARATAKENKKPVYVVRDIVDPKIFAVKQLIAVGGTAPSLAPFIAKALHVPYMIPQAAPVANAVGAAVARETMELTVRVDTETRTLVIPELGRSEKTSCRTLGEAKKIAEKVLFESAKAVGLTDNNEGEIIFEEDFPVIQGWGKENRLITARIQLKAGVKYHVQ